MQQDRYARFTQWLLNNGAFLSPKLKYPSLFQGVPGVAATQDIADREAVLAVPCPLAINHLEIMQGELKTIFEEKYYFFSFYEEEAYIYVLVLFLVYEKLKGESSFWFPYIDVTRDIPFQIDRKEYKKVKDSSLKKLIK